jgi:hypothetical protein
MSAIVTAPARRPSGPRLPALRPAPAIRRAPRAPFVIAVLLLLVAGLGTLLLLNTYLAQGSFALHELQTKVGRLTDQEQALQEKAAKLAGPQRLARKAAALGMVAAPNPAFLRAADGKVLGDPAPAAPRPVVVQPDTSTPDTSSTSGTTDTSTNTGNGDNPAANNAAANNAAANNAAAGPANNGGAGSGQGEGQ